MDERERRVREIAHRLWEEEGRPSDQDRRHWEEAERIVETQDRGTGGAPERESASTHPERPEAPPSEPPTGGAKQRVARKAPAKRAAKRPPT
jgi:hypothetical protein